MYIMSLRLKTTKNNKKDWEAEYAGLYKNSRIEINQLRYKNEELEKELKNLLEKIPFEELEKELKNRLENFPLESDVRKATIGLHKIK